jgi:PAS domain S-box-containing protein
MLSARHGTSAPGERQRDEAFVPRDDITRIFRISLLMLLCGGVAVGTIALLSQDWKALGGAACVVLIIPALLRALRSGRPRLAMTGAVSVLLVVACFEVIYGDGIRDVGVSLFTVVALVSALLLDRRSARTFSALSVLSVAAIGAAELSGVMSVRPSHVVSLHELAILVCLLGTFAVLIHAVAGALYTGLEDAALNEQTYREIFNAASDGIAIHDAQTFAILDANDSACAISGFSREELVGKSLREFLPSEAEPADVAALEARFAGARSGQAQTFEWKAERKDGSDVWLEVALRAATIRGQHRVLSAVRDISDRKASADQLRLAERLNAVGQLAGGVAHDFNNQLTGIVANATLVRGKLPTDAAAQACIDAILHCSNRAADLTRQLLAFARRGGRRDDVVDIDVLVREVVSLLERSIDKRVSIELDLADDGGCRVRGDASFLSSAFLNLGLNARDAMPEGGRLCFETRSVSAAALPERARAQLTEPHTEYVRLRVSDTGEGIAPEALSRVFEPFFTTKPKGNGLGLSAAYGTVQAHHGAMLVSSELRTGTTFTLFLPVTTHALARKQAAESSHALPPLRILLAEDERVVGRATELMLQEFGCVVTWCRDGREALDAFEHDADGFDVVMLDHSMPRLLGSDVALQIAARRPLLPIITTSGFAEGLQQEDACHNKRIFLPKPFDADQLKAALAHCRLPAQAAPRSPA